MQLVQFFILADYSSSKTVSSLWFPASLGQVLVTTVLLYSHT